MIFYSLQGFTIAVHLDFNSRSIRRTCIARCTKGDLIWDAIRREVSWQPADGSKKIKSYDYDQDEIYRKQMHHFFECIEDGQSPAVSLAEGAAVLRMIEAARKSNAIGKKIAIA